jgi:hypothetical protein
MPTPEEIADDAMGLPHAWMAPVVRSVYRMREAGIEPTAVLLPITGHHYILPVTVMGIPVTWSSELRFPHVAIECV